MLDQDRVVRYQGRIDGSYTFGSGVGFAAPQQKRRDMVEAVEELLAGKPVSVPLTESKGCLIGRVRSAKEDSQVTYASHIAALFNERCVKCHREGQIAPFAMTSYDEVAGWGIEALHRAIDGLKCTTAVHICYGYGIKANIDWKNSLGEEWRQYEKIFPALARSRIGQVSLECINSRVPLKLLSLLDGKDLLIGAIDVATDTVETPEQVAGVIGDVIKVVPKEKVIACTNCGMAPMRRDIAEAKLKALGAGAALARQKFG